MAATRQPGKILIIDDEEGILFSIRTLLSREKYVCETAQSGEAGLRRFREAGCDFDVVITDLTMPGMDGMQVLRAIKELRTETYVVMITAHGSTENAVEAMRAGAHDYLSKPFENEKLKILMRHIFERISLARENVSLRHQLKTQYRLIGTSENMVAVREKIARVSPADVTVLITGESGTGKELVAREIHAQSQRRSKNFVTLNCAAIPADLLENELFGHEKGAYTGAHSEQKGKFELADGGSLFLDEIGDMPLQIQAKVLRAIQEQTIERLGGTASVRVNVRIIAATNKDLEEEIKKKAFREDLYYRLNVINITLPALRERRGDIALLIKHFISLFSEKLGRTEPRMTADAIAALSGYGWPGNVRQLQNTIERILVLSDTAEIDAYSVTKTAELPGLFAPGPSPAFNDGRMPAAAEGDENGPDARFAGARPAGAAEGMSYYCVKNMEELGFYEAQKALLEKFETDYITRALKKNSGNIKKTAEQIGMDRSLLHTKIKGLKIDPDSFKDK